MEFEGGANADTDQGGHQVHKKVNVKVDNDEDGVQINGFMCIPKKQTPFNTIAADKLRTFLLMCLALHMLFFTMEFLIYDFVIGFIVGEMFKMWLSYYCYMTLNNIALYGYVIALFLAAIGGIFSVFAVGIWFPLFLGQIGWYGYGGYLLFLKIKDFTTDGDEKKELSGKAKMLDEKLNKGAADLEKQAMKTA